MTKKSASRVIRDAEKKEKESFFAENTMWNDLSDIHLQIGNQIKSFGTIAYLTQRRELYAFLVDSATVTANIQTLTADLTNIAKEIEEIQSKYQGRTGKVETQDDHLMAIDLYMAYRTVIERIEGILVPTFGQILEAFNLAECAWKENEAKLAADKEAANGGVLEPLRPEQQLTPTPNLAAKLANSL